MAGHDWVLPYDLQSITYWKAIQSMSFESVHEIPDFVNPRGAFAGYAERGEWVWTESCKPYEIKGLMKMHLSKEHAHSVSVKSLLGT